MSKKRTHRRNVLWGGILLGAPGCVLVAVNLVHNRAWNATPVEVPLPLVNGTESRARFTAVRDAPYEIEIAATWRDVSDDARKIVEAKHGPSPLDVQWVVTSDGETIAEGDCRDYLYILSPSPPRRVHDWLLAIAPDAPVLAGMGARGVGSFQAQARRRYDIRARVGTTLTALDAAFPRLVVRLDRLVWKRHTDRTRWTAYAGFAALGFAALSFAALCLRFARVHSGSSLRVGSQALP